MQGCGQDENARIIWARVGLWQGTHVALLLRRRPNFLLHHAAVRSYLHVRVVPRPDGAHAGGFVPRVRLGAVLEVGVGA